MIRAVVLFLILVSLPGCFATKKRCLRLYPPLSDTVVVELVRDSIAYRDTTLIVTLPGETKIDSVIVHIGPGVTHSDTLVLETDFARAEAYILLFIFGLIAHCGRLTTGGRNTRPLLISTRRNTFRRSTSLRYGPGLVRYYSLFCDSRCGVSSLNYKLSILNGDLTPDE